jgi:predicted double-glycine peptidase
VDRSRRALYSIVRTAELSYWQRDTPHVVVLAGLEAERVYLFDPAVETASIEVSAEELLLAWSYLDYTYAALYVG